MIEKGKVAQSINLLLEYLPNYQNELTALSSRYNNNIQLNNSGRLSVDEYRIEDRKIIYSLIAFLDSLAKGNENNASEFLFEDLNKSTKVNELINNQIEHAKSTIRENKIFRTTVAILFFIATVFSISVGISYFNFLSKELLIMGLLTLTISLFFSIGLLALYALSLIIRGSVFNQTSLNFYNSPWNI